MEPKTLSLEDLLKEKENLVAQANMVNGAMQIVNALISKLTPKEEASKEAGM